MSKCITCFLNTGFIHNYKPSEAHEHIDDEIMYIFNEEERREMEWQESIDHYSHTYYGVTPFHPEGMMLERIVQNHFKEVLS